MSRDEKWDAMFIIAGAPFQDDSLGLALRTVDAVLQRNRRVHVWACGFTNWLTDAHAPDHKPRGALSWDDVYTSAAGHVLALLNAYPETLLWTACRSCCEERNLTEHIAGVRMRLATQMRRYMDRSDTVLTVGVT